MEGREVSTTLHSTSNLMHLTALYLEFDDRTVQFTSVPMTDPNQFVFNVDCVTSSIRG